jgi:hypothetical protein
MTLKKCEAPCRWRGKGARRSSTALGNVSLPHRPPTAQVKRLRLAARCLSLTPIFTGDAPLAAELFDEQGSCVETWSWP